MECLSAFALVAGLTGIVGLALALSALKEARAVRAELGAIRTELWQLAGQLQRIQVGEGRLSGEAAGEVAAAAEAAPAIVAPPPPLAPVTAVVADLAPAEPPPPPYLGGGAVTPGAPRAAAPSEPAEPSLLPTQPAFSFDSTASAAGGAAAAPPPARPAASLEERLGARAPVWIGSIALALAGAFLVKYSVDRGWIGPTVRLALAILFGVALLGAGEALRTRIERIAAGLSAAGIAVLFAAWLAGVNVYHLIAPALGFTFLALTAALAVLLALRQGPIVALVGLVGGFLTPSLISTAEPNARVLFGYLLLLQAGLLTAARRQRWRWLPELALAGGLLWVVAWLAGAFGAADALWLALFLVGMVVVVVLIERLTGRTPAGAGVEECPEATWLQPALAVAGAVMAMGLVTARAGYTPREWAFQALLVTAALVLARRREELHGLAWLAVGVTFALLAAWGWNLPVAQEPRFLWTALAIGGLCAAGSYAAHFGAARPARWTVLAALAGLAFFVFAWASATALRPRLPWGALALAAAALYLAAAVPLARRRARAAAAEVDEHGPALAALAVAVTAFTSLAVPLELERQWWTVAWALEVPALVWLAGHFRLPALRRLAAALALGVAARLLANPEVLSYPIGTRPVLNWLLYGYGLALVAIAGAAALARRDRTFGPGRLAPGLEALGVALAFALVSLEVRQGFHPGRLGTGVPSLVEWGTYTVVWLLLGFALLAAGRRLSLERVEQGGTLIMMAGLLGAVAGSGFLGNPLWQHEAVGATPVVNFLLWIYGVPALLVPLAGRLLRRRGEDRLAAFCGVGALALLFLLVTLEVTQAFHGTYLDDEPATVAEKYAYSAAWLLFGTGLLVAGIARRGRFLRYASLAVMSLTVGKVFLFDTAHLTDLYRVLSFLGLGLSLLLLAFLYQRFVFRAPAD